MVNTMDCEFDLQSRSNVHFRTNTHGTPFKLRQGFYQNDLIRFGIKLAENGWYAVKPTNQFFASQNFTID